MPDISDFASEDGPEERLRTSDGVVISVYERGPKDGPEILLIHGVAQCHLAFARQMLSELAERCRLVTFDLRGHGASEKPLTPSSYQDGRTWAAEIQSVIEAKDLRRPVLVGWSLGGRLIRQYLMHYGDHRLAGIHFVAARPIEHPDVTGPGSLAMRDSRNLRFGARLQAEMDFLRNCFAKHPGERDLRLAIAYNMIVPQAVRDAIGDWATDPEASTEALRRVRVPTLISHGLADRLIRPAAAEMTKAAIPHARISWYEDCGHSPFYENAARFNAELARFVAACSRAAP